MPTRAVLLDALGTLVELEPPWVHLAAALGVAPEGRVEQAFRAEMDYYRERADSAVDDASLERLRGECAALLSAGLGTEISVGAMMAAIRFRAFPDAAPALAELGRRRLTLVCVSNWDVSLADVLDGVGLGASLDGVVNSAAAGARKPDPAIFDVALALAGCHAEEALHVGDTPAEDVAGARAAGISALLIDRSGGGQIASLGEIVEHLAG